MQKYIENLKTKNIHIVGAFGAEGSTVLEFLAKNGIKNITAHDFSIDKEELWQNYSKTHLWIRKKSERLAAFENLLKLPSKLNLKSEYLAGIMEADMIFAPSSWSLYKPNFPALRDAQKKGIEFSSITKLYFDLAKGKIISVTGTKGKGTTSRLIYEILCHPDPPVDGEGSLANAMNRTFVRDSSSRISGTQNDSIGMVYLAGNDRRAGQELEKISKMDKDDILVLETSNRQLLNDLGNSPDIGVITNISPDHIDEHGSFENYIQAKKNLFKYSLVGDIAVLNYDNDITRAFGNDLVKREIDVYFFSRKEEVKKGIYLEKDRIYVNIKGKEYVCDIYDINLIGEHNLENFLAAALSAYLAGASPEKIRAAIKNFKGLPHRVEFVGEYNGVKFYDDLASTNPDSTIAAIKAISNHESRITNHESKLFLIGGGDDKGMDYAGLALEIIDKVNVLILLPGSGSEKIINGITNQELRIKNKNKNSPPEMHHPWAEKLKIVECDDFAEAMNLIKIQTKAGDIVLISPASAHFRARYIDILKKPLRNIIFCHFEPVSRQGEIA